MVYIYARADWQSDSRPWALAKAYRRIADRAARTAAEPGDSVAQEMAHGAGGEVWPVALEAATATFHLLVRSGARDT